MKFIVLFLFLFYLWFVIIILFLFYLENSTNNGDLPKSRHILRDSDTPGTPSQNSFSPNTLKQNVETTTFRNNQEQKTQEKSYSEMSLHELVKTFKFTNTDTRFKHEKYVDYHLCDKDGKKISYNS